MRVHRGGLDVEANTEGTALPRCLAGGGRFGSLGGLGSGRRGGGRCSLGRRSGGCGWLRGLGRLGFGWLGLGWLGGRRRGLLSAGGAQGQTAAEHGERLQESSSRDLSAHAA